MFVAVSSTIAPRAGAVSFPRLLEPGARTAKLPTLRQEIVTALPLLRARAMRLARDPRVAEDLVQDALERAFRFEATFAPGTNLKAWLQQVLYSVFVSRCRRQRRERRALDALAVDPCAWTRVDGSPEMVSLTPRLEQALATLPATFSGAIRLVDLEDRSYKDAAEELGVPVGTVMSRLFRGRRLLAAALGDQGGEAVGPTIARAA
ncbi:MAG: sigma-70 family RNA polymerase sigma factor [Polyangiaceae bacterium]|nr:sigma-70 family RNA polymerase sigma factor [Polyangiaceae bacterium]